MTKIRLKMTLMTPAANSLPTETPVRKEYMTIMVLGGIRKPSAPPACTMPTASRRSYLRCSMAGTAMTPIDRTVALLTPSMAAMSAQMSTVPIPSAPRARPAQR